MFFFAISIIYFLIIFAFCFGIFLLKKGSNSQLHTISVIIAARNEEKYIPELLKILLDQNYPKNKFEIIVADDRSTDETSNIVKELIKINSNLKLVRIEKESKTLVGKKGALNAAISASGYDILAFTDADCLPTRNWLMEISRHFTPEIDFIAGYSPLIIKNKLFSFLKNLERASIFAVTAGAFGINWKISSCGRNMAYRRTLFLQVEGFSGIGHIRSGDDDLMLLKMSQHINRTTFMFTRDSIVKSYDKEDVEQMIQLENRRASKWKFYPYSIKILTLFIFLYYILFLTALCGLIINYISPFNFAILLLIKIIPEFLLLTVFLFKIRRIRLLLAFPFAELVYIPYFIYFALKGTFGKFKWKN